MDLDQFLKDIEDKVINNELKKALALIKDFSEEHHFESIKDDSVTQLAHLNNLENLNRTNQISQEDFLIQNSQISAAVLVLKKEAVLFFKNPDMAQEAKKLKASPAVATPAPSVQASPAPPAAMHNITNTNDWFKMVILGLFVLFGGGLGYLIFISDPMEQFKIFSTVTILAFIFLIKVYDDNMKFKREKLLLENQQN